jgi:3-deoxy-D-manno-octulosonic-acid transferase
MRYLLNVVYGLLLLVLLPYLLYVSLSQGKYRQGWRQKLWGRVPRRRGTQPCLWLHAVSVGEANLLAAVLQRFEAEHPDWECVISTTTRAGFELARRRYAPRSVFYCPLDFSWAVDTALRRIRPTLLVLAELELWPNLLALAHRRGVRLAVINGRLSERSYRGYRRIRPLLARVLACLDAVAVQNEAYAERFCELGVDPKALLITGSIKFDGAETDRSNLRTTTLARLWQLADDDVVFLAGSTQAPEEQFALDAFRRLMHDFPRLRLMLVPRHPERFDEVARQLNASGLGWDLRSRLVEQAATAAQRILLVDSVGELGAWWGTAHVAFVGGSLGRRGGQNMIEPAAYGAAVCFGPNTRNFRDIVELLLQAEAATVVRDPAELAQFLRQCLEQPTAREQMGARARRLVLSQKGAAQRTLDFLHARCQIERAVGRRAAG